MFGLGTPELLVIFAIALLLFGGKKLPELGSGLGKALRSFRDGVQEVEEVTGMKDLGNKIPGIREATAVQEKIDQAKDLGKILSK
jgi:sec-independent protein translocase protein TatA